MPNYRRAHVPGGCYYFTVVTYHRRKIFDKAENQRLLGHVIRDCQQSWPFEINAIVLLPDHLHTIWTLPRGDENYSARWSVIKKTFTRRYLSGGGQDAPVSSGKSREERRGIWQPRFWEHTLQDEDGFEAHLDYIHFNPVKHGYVNCPHEWRASSFHRWVTRGVYERNSACGVAPTRDLGPLEDIVGEPAD